METLVKGLEIPVNCDECDIVDGTFNWCGVAHKRIDNPMIRPEWCPMLMTLPKRHGGLIDADKLCNDVLHKLGIRSEAFLLPEEQVIYKMIKDAEKIVEAEE